MLKTRHTEDSKQEAGIDEAGRGCLWGPLVAAVVVWPEESTWSEELRAISTRIKDSKKLSAKQRAALEEAIKKHAVAWGTGRVDAAEIDTLGMTKANRLAFTRALETIPNPGRIIVDGIISANAGGEIEEALEPHADGIYLSVAAASIIAKEAHDTIVKGFCAADATLDGRYGLLSSKGYGTAKHRSAIKEHGMHEQHRRLFLRKLLGLEHTVHVEYTSTNYLICDE
jgi:ribonuclease HII